MWIDGIGMFNRKDIYDKAIICLTIVYFSYFEELKEKIPNIEKYLIYKPILLEKLKDETNELYIY